ncbi:hypothetical protein [Haloplanus sp. C73]|uniref:hypothetical protein n=1 Tax=Haloplanus sp. C73 TaxID=3421641 RepID=UPI003EB84894
MSATAAPEAGPTTEPSIPQTGIRGSIAAAGRRLRTGNQKVDTAVDAAVGVWLNVHEKASAKADDYVDRDKTVAHNIIGATITLGISVIMLILMAIVAGYFVAEAPSDGAFSPAIEQVESIGGTAFILLAVALLAVPVVAVVGYFINSGLGGFIQAGGGMRR